MATAVPLQLGCAHATEQCLFVLLCPEGSSAVSQGIHPIPSHELALSCTLLLLFWVPFTPQRSKQDEYKDRDAKLEAF